MGDAAAALDGCGAERVFLATGRQQLDAFRGCRQWFLVRSIEPVAEPLAASFEIRDRGPFTREGERRLFVEHRIDTVVASGRTRDTPSFGTAVSGTESTWVVK